MTAGTGCATAIEGLRPDLVVPTQKCAVRVWHAAYDALLPAGQVEHMLAQRNSVAALESYLGAVDRWFDVALRQSGSAATEVVGYTSGRLTSPTSARLEQIYVVPDCWGSGLAQALLDRAMSRAEDAGAERIDLTVNKANLRAQRFYARNGFALVDEVITDIGNGFVMDDYVWARPL